MKTRTFLILTVLSFMTARPVAGASFTPLGFLPASALAGAWTQPQGAAWFKSAGLYQLADTRIPDHAVVSETV